MKLDYTNNTKNILYNKWILERSGDVHKINGLWSNLNMYLIIRSNYRKTTSILAALEKEYSTTYDQSLGSFLIFSNNESALIKENEIIIPYKQLSGGYFVGVDLLHGNGVFYCMDLKLN